MKISASEMFLNQSVRTVKFRDCLILVFIWIVLQILLSVDLLIRLISHFAWLMFLHARLLRNFSLSSWPFWSKFPELMYPQNQTNLKICFRWNLSISSKFRRNTGLRFTNACEILKKIRRAKLQVAVKVWSTFTKREEILVFQANLP